MYLVLCFSGLISANKRVTRQISFSSNKIAPSESSANQNENKPQISSDKISFGVSEPKSKPKEVSLKDILKFEGPGPLLSARFGFSSVTSKIGQSCVTPLGESGTCRFIVDTQCRPVLNRIIKYGVTQEYFMSRCIQLLLLILIHFQYHRTLKIVLQQCCIMT